MEDRPDDRDDATLDDSRWREAGDRIETLLEASSAGGALARERAEQLVRELVGLYGAGLTRVVELLDDAAVERLTRDDLVASLLLVHGLHPHDVATRVGNALDSVRPYLGSHGGDVHLVDIVDGVVRLELAGSCKSCPSSSVTLELAVEDAVRAAAPEIESIEVVAAQTESAGVISADSLFSRVRADGARSGNWVAVPELAELNAGEVGGFTVAGLTVLACRVGAEVYAYRDHCPACDRSLAGAALERRLGFPAGDAVLRCPACRAHYDVVHAGARVDGEGHLEPLPVLVRSGELSVAVPVEVNG
ncbi:NifU family protein [Nocardia araoensis]|uniref:NifU family protein n=1 Tax=Nocardia araoensis TaxID=228600 RepID=UPI0002FD7DC7|nr:NifU family protein [Nocardia araoensis]